MYVSHVYSERIPIAGHLGWIQKVWLGRWIEAPGAEAPRLSASRVERRRREDRGVDGLGLGKGLSFDFWAQKGEFLCILGLIKLTFGRPCVSIFGQQPFKGGGRSPPSPVDTPLLEMVGLWCHWWQCYFALDCWQLLIGFICRHCRARTLKVNFLEWRCYEMCYIELCQFARFVVTVILLTALNMITDDFFVCFYELVLTPHSWLGRIAAIARCGLLLQMEYHGLSVCLSVCWSRSFDLQKHLIESRCHLGECFGWAQETMY